MPSVKCEHPTCHEAMKMCIHKMVTKKAMWIAVLALGVPIFVSGVKVWSQQEADILRFADKGEVAQCKTNQTKLDEKVLHMNVDLIEIKTSQHETQRDVKEILRYMRDGHN